MERLIKLLKTNLKTSIILALIVGNYLAFQSFVKYPFTQGSIGPQNETKIVAAKTGPAETKTTSKDETLTYLQSVQAPLASVQPKEVQIDPSPIRILPIQNKKEVIILGKKNTLLFRGVVTMLSVAKMQAQILAMAAKLPPGTPIYLVLDTPGGEVEAGNILIDNLKALPNKVNTLTLFAASMGFHIAESLDDRLILPSGTLMSHRMRVGGIEGQVPGEAVTAINYALRLSDRMDKRASSRLGMKLEDYRAMIQNEVWKDGQDAVDANFADREVLALCGTDLQGTYKEDINLIFFVITATWSECPLIRFPIDLQMKNQNQGGIMIGEAKKAEYGDFIKTLMYDREGFVHKYIVTGKYKEFMAK